MTTPCQESWKNKLQICDNYAKGIFNAACWNGVFAKSSDPANPGNKDNVCVPTESRCEYWKKNADVFLNQTQSQCSLTKEQVENLRTEGCKCFCGKTGCLRLLSGGAIAGIVIGCILLIALIVLFKKGKLNQAEIKKFFTFKKKK